jgi:ribosomal protein S18 acetylase RimI-like enzyme
MSLRDKGIIIRNTIESDLRQIHDEGKKEPLLTDTAFNFSADNLSEILATENVLAYTAARKKTVLGFIIGAVKDTECKVYWMLVKKNFRKTGIGTELLQFFIENAKKNDVNNFFIAVFNNNSESVNFFNKNGFIVKNTFVEFYRKSDEKFYPGLSE